MTLSMPDTNPAPQSAEAGFSLLEVLIASVILLFVAIGVLPLFQRAMANNTQGREITQVVHRAKSEMEEIIQLDFNDALLTWTGADETEITQYWDDANEAWITVADLTAVPDGTDYTRQIRVKQFNLDELQSNETTAQWTALPADAPPNEVHLKQVEVEVAVHRGRSTAAGGIGRNLVIRSFKSF